jgi:hypothetical protein
MKCANRLCNSEALYFRSGSLHAIDYISTEQETADEPILRQKVIWLCDNCSRLFTVDTWRPPGKQLRTVIMQEQQVRDELMSSTLYK